MEVRDAIITIHEIKGHTSFGPATASREPSGDNTVTFWKETLRAASHHQDIRRKPGSPDRLDLQQVFPWYEQKKA